MDSHSPVVSFRGHRVWNTQPLGGLPPTGSRRSRSGPGAGRRATVRPRTAPRCRGGAVRRTRSRTADLHHPPQVQHHDPVRQVPDQAQVVRDEQVGDPLGVCRSASRLRMAACTDTSSAEVGSSHTTISGRPANARAIATRCLSPPDSWPWRSGRCRSSSRTEVISCSSRSRSRVPDSPASRDSGRLIRPALCAAGSAPSPGSGTRSAARAGPTAAAAAHPG